MTASGTPYIIDPPPDLTTSEIAKIRESELAKDV
jgi:hypothetical protein